jgi:hypothetical protein
LHISKNIRCAGANKHAQRPEENTSLHGPNLNLWVAQPEIRPKPSQINGADCTRLGLRCNVTCFQVTRRGAPGPGAAIQAELVTHIINQGFTHTSVPCVMPWPGCSPAHRGSSIQHPRPRAVSPPLLFFRSGGERFAPQPRLQYGATVHSTAGLGPVVDGWRELTRRAGAVLGRRGTAIICANWEADRSGLRNRISELEVTKRGKVRIVRSGGSGVAYPAGAGSAALLAPAPAPPRRDPGSRGKSPYSGYVYRPSLAPLCRGTHQVGRTTASSRR